MKKYHWLLVVGLLVFCFSLKLSSLLQTAYANGWDGYYYLMQLQSMVVDQKMQSPDFSLVYPYLLVFQIFLPDDVLAYKVAVASLETIFALTGFFLIYKISGKYSLGILAIAIAIFSPSLTFFASQFTKNLLGIIVLLWFIYFFLQGNRTMILIFLVLAFFTHRLVAAAAIIIFVVNIIQSRFSWKVLLIVSVILLSASLLAPGIFHLSDLLRFQGQLSWQPQLAPYSLAAIWLKKPVDWWWIAEAYLLYLAYFVLLFYSYKNKKYRLLVVLLSLAILILPFYIFDVMEIGYRFFLTFLIVISIITPFLFYQLKDKIIYAICSLLLILSFFSKAIYQPERHDPPHRLYLNLADRLQEKLENANASLVIAHKGLAEVIIYKTEFDALNWVPEYTIEQSEVWRVVYAWPLTKKRKMENFRNFRLSANYYLMPETSWQKLVKHAETINDQELTTMIYHDLNPAKERPEYLRKGKNISSQ